MLATSTEVEHIVQLVVERLRSVLNSSSTATIDVNSAVAVESQKGSAESSDLKAETGKLVLNSSIICLSSLENRLRGITNVCVGPKAVVTPSVRDLLKSNGIQLTRSAVNSSCQGNRADSEPRAGASLVCGSAAWFDRLAKQLNKAGAVFSPCTDDLAAGCIAKHFDGGGKRAVWISLRPHAAVLHVSGNPQISASYLPSLAELSEVCEQTRSRVLVVDGNRWSVAAIGNLLRKWERMD